ncbi:amidohydrolase family protein, partial [Streptomyces racemochromogenes]
DAAPLVEALAEGGASGFKVHEDMGAHTRALDTALRVAEEHDVQVALHSDGLNECLSVEDTLRVLEGRTIHAFHIEGCGGGHVPNVLKMAGVPNVIGSSTNPTLPFGRDAVAEHYGMIVSVHDLKPDLPGDAAMARDRIRAGTMGAEDVLHDLGAIGITSSDAQGMGRAGET